MANLPEPLIDDGIQQFADNVNALGLNNDLLAGDTLKLNELSLGVINSETNPSNRMLGLLDKIYTEKQERENKEKH